MYETKWQLSIDIGFMVNTIVGARLYHLSNVFYYFGITIYCHTCFHMALFEDATVSLYEHQEKWKENKMIKKGEEQNGNRIPLLHPEQLLSQEISLKNY